MKMTDAEAFDFLTPKGGPTIEQEAAIEHLRHRLQRLTVENNLKTRAVDRWVPCPDHRDKTDDQGCYVCRIEKLQARLAADQQKGGGGEE